MRKIGLYLNGILMSTYEDTPEKWEEAIGDCKFATEETGILHELQYFEVGEETDHD